jgi:hypothetical protein
MKSAPDFQQLRESQLRVSHLEQELGQRVAQGSILQNFISAKNLLD